MQVRKAWSRMAQKRILPRKSAHSAATSARLKAMTQVPKLTEGKNRDME